jgi:ribosomal protein S18 acetylase RimI-like enzyme
LENIEFIHAGREMLDVTKPLWEKLNDHHKGKAKYFNKTYEDRKFEDRMKKFIEDPNLIVGLLLAKDATKNQYVGYCISSINTEMQGEIDSIFIESDYRGLGIGDKFMTLSLEWLNNHNVKQKILVVAGGNEQALGFYEKYGFHTRTLVLEQV